MARNRKGTPPRYRLHRPTGQAVVTIYGHDEYLGRYGSPASHQKYECLIKAWRKRQEQDSTTPSEGQPTPMSLEELTVNEVSLAYIRHAKAYYKPTLEGEQKEVDCIRDALKLVRHLHGRTLAVEFGPKALYYELAGIVLAVASLVLLMRFASVNGMSTPTDEVVLGREMA